MANISSQKLLTEIREFLEETRMGPSYFGKVAVGNSELVKRLEEGRSILTNTEARARAFMRTARKSSKAKHTEAAGT